MSQSTLKKHPISKWEIFGWCCFDFANSSFTTIIITVLFPIYFVNVICGQAADSSEAAQLWLLQPLTLWGTILSISQIIVLSISPAAGAFADRYACKKKLLLATALLCSFCTSLLVWPITGDVFLTLALIMIANIAFSLGENLCAGFLPEISTPKTAGRISGYGWSFGYMGGLVSLLLIFLFCSEEGSIFLNKHPLLRWIQELLPISLPLKTYWAFPITGLFFVTASLPTFLLLRERAVPTAQMNAPGTWKRISQTLHSLRQYRTLAFFLLSFMCLMAGLNAIFAFSSLYATNVLHLSVSENVMLFAVMQITSALGAFLFGFLQDKLGSKLPLICALALWGIISLLIFHCQTKSELFWIGNLAGLCVGSTQSACRAIVSMLTPVERAGEFFGFWGFFGKLGAVLGPFIFGGLCTVTDFRIAMLLNGFFFLAALLILLPLNLKAQANG